MKLYSQICFGFLIVFFCQEPKPLAVSDFCQVAGPEIVRLQGLSAQEVSGLSRARKEAIINLRRSYAASCQPKPSPSS